MTRYHDSIRRMFTRLGVAGIFLLVLGGTLLTSASAASAAPATPSPPAQPVNISIAGDSSSGMGSAITTVVLLGVISLVPALLLMVTAFPRIVVVLGLVRSALGTPSIPPTQVIVGLSLFLTLFVMGPTFSKVNDVAVQPYLNNKISLGSAYDAGVKPLRTFMFKNTDESDLALMTKLSNQPRPAKPDDVPTATLVPAYVLSELKTAFLIGFIIFIPFVLIDLIVSAILTSVGMVMLPPALVSLPFKILLFVVCDGWYLIVQSLVESFRA